MWPCNCAPVAQADTAYHLLNHYGFKLSIDSIQDKMAIWAQQDEMFLRPGLCNVAAKYSKTYDQLIANALKIDTPASDVTFFITSHMRGKTIRIVCSMQEGWSTHYSNNWDKLDAILVWMGFGNFGACELMTRHLYQEDAMPCYSLTQDSPCSLSCTCNNHHRTAAHHHVCSHVRSTSSATYDCEQEEAAFTGSRDTAGS